MALERTRLGRTGLEVCRLGLAGGYGLPADDVRRAIEIGLNYLWWDPDFDEMTEGLRSVLPSHRKQLILAAGTYERSAKGVQNAIDECLKTLPTDYLDAFLFHYVETEREWASLMKPSSGFEAAQKAKEAGKVRFIGFSSHQRPLAAKMALSGEFDVAHVRYNCAHIKAETDFFPAAQEAGIGVVIYTPLRWTELLKPPRCWDGEPPKPYELYRFVLEHPAVHVVMSAPSNGKELEENLKSVKDGYRLSKKRLEELRRYGQLFREEMA